MAPVLFDLASGDVDSSYLPKAAKTIEEEYEMDFLMNCDPVATAETPEMDHPPPNSEQDGHDTETFECQDTDSGNFMQAFGEEPGSDGAVDVPITIGEQPAKGTHEITTCPAIVDDVGTDNDDDFSMCSAEFRHIMEGFNDDEDDCEGDYRSEDSYEEDYHSKDIESEEDEFTEILDPEVLGQPSLADKTAGNIHNIHYSADSNLGNFSGNHDTTFRSILASAEEAKDEEDEEEDEPSLTVTEVTMTTENSRQEKKRLRRQQQRRRRREHKTREKENVDVKELKMATLALGFELKDDQISMILDVDNDDSDMTCFKELLEKILMPKFFRQLETEAMSDVSFDLFCKENEISKAIRLFDHAAATNKISFKKLMRILQDADAIKDADVKLPKDKETRRAS